MLASDQSDETTRYRFSGYSLDPCKRCLFDPQGKPVPLSSRALDTLQLLVANRGETLSKAFLVDKVWPDSFVDENNLNQAITGIRRALGDTKAEGRFIKTVTGRGYCFVAELEQTPASAEAARPADALPDPMADSQPDLSPAVLPASPRRQALSRSWSYALVMLLVSGVGGAAFVLDSRPEDALQVERAAPDAAPALAENAASAREKFTNSIAVLPFRILTPATDRNNEFFASGLHDEIINQLGRLPNLNVVSRRSVMASSLQDLSMKEIGALLRVESIVTGTILFVDGTTRIKLQMLDPESRMIKWTFEHDLLATDSKDFLQTQRELVTKAITSLRERRGVDESLPRLDWPTQSFAAYRYNMAAQRAFVMRDFPKSLQLSRRALTEDPDYQDALYNYARVNYFLASSPVEGMNTAAHVKQGLESAERLIELAPQSPKGYVLKAVALANRSDWEGAMSEVKRLQNSGAPLRDLQLLSPLLMTLGEHRTTIGILEASLQTDPLNSNDRGFLMAAFEAVGNSVQARLEYATGDELMSDWWGDTVNIFLSLGRGEPIANPESISSAEIRSLVETFNAGEHASVIAELHARQDDVTPRSSVFVHYAAMAAVLGEDALAIAYLRRAVELVPTHLHWMWLPVFSEARQHPDMRELLESSGVLAYWERHGAPEICASAQYSVCSSTSP